MTTDKRLVEAAGKLLDSGGEEAVTLRAVGNAVGVSHNAPYKHFANRNALLAAVATVSFADLAKSMVAIRGSTRTTTAKLVATLDLLIDYNREYPARYRLLFNNPETAAASGELKVKAMEAFEHCRLMVHECQEANELPAAPSETLTSLIFATVHGLLAMEANGQLHPEKGLSSVKGSLEFLLTLLSPSKP